MKIQHCAVSYFVVFHLKFFSCSFSILLVLCN
nr:MAG TPA: hypothetical protein [Caudoviricetes sp.]